MEAAPEQSNATDPRLQAALDSAGLASDEAGAAPGADGPQLRDPVADFEAHCTPEAIVETLDGFQTSIVHAVCVLSSVELDERHAKLIPMDEGEKVALKPWASFALEGVSDELRKDPKLGFGIFLVVAGMVVGRRALIVAAAIKSAKAERLEREKIARAKSAQVEQS